MPTRRRKSPSNRFCSFLERIQKITLLAYHLCSGNFNGVEASPRKKGRRNEGPVQGIKLKSEKKGWALPNIRCLATLEDGAFGPFNICEHRIDGEITTEKVIIKTRTNEAILKAEVKCLRRLSGEPRILRMIALSESTLCYHMYLERFNGIPISRLDAGRMSPWILATILRNIGKGMRAMHSRGILHRQMTGNNILVNNVLDVKLTGFDLAAVSRKAYGCVGVVGYLAPEVVAQSYRFLQIRTGCRDYYTIRNLSYKRGPYTCAVDYFSLGVTIFDMFFHQIPALMNLDGVREEYMEDAVLMNMYEAEYSFPEHLLENVDNFGIFKKLLGDLLSPTPLFRCVGTAFKKSEVFEILWERRSSHAVVDLVSFMKDRTTSPLMRLYHNPSQQFIPGGDLKDIFFYLATRPRSFPFWELYMNNYYEGSFTDYTAHWNSL